MESVLSHNKNERERDQATVWKNFEKRKVVIIIIIICLTHFIRDESTMN